MKRKKCTGLLLTAVAFSAMVALSFAGVTERVSVDSSGNEGDGNSDYSSVNDDGRYVAFHSTATNLVAGDTNMSSDIFVHDRQTGATVRVSVNSYGNEANGDSYRPYISSDGRFVAFHSKAAGLTSVPVSVDQIFVHDRDSDGNGVYDEPGGISTVLASRGPTSRPGNGDSCCSSMSFDGRYLVFASISNNLSLGDLNNASDVFFSDRDENENGIYDELMDISIKRVSVDSSGNMGNYDSQAPSVSGNGGYAAFESNATNLVAGDTNGVTDIFVHDVQTGSTVRASVDGNGGQGNGFSFRPSLSNDGRFVAFHSSATNLVPADTNNADDVFVHDRDADGNGVYDEPGGTSTVRASVDGSGGQGNNGSDNAFISPDGRFVTFRSSASNLVSGDTNNADDVFVHDRDADGNGVYDEPGGISTERVSVDSSGNQGNGHNDLPSLSGDARYAAFSSAADNLVPGDTNAAYDIFAYDRFDNDGDGYAYYEECDDTDPTVYPGAAETKHDGIDQDCNGYDLTIDITYATYRTNQDRLSVESTSALNGSAALELEGYGPMNWKAGPSKWEITVRAAGGDPGVVTVCGVEGCESAPTVAQ